MSEEVIKLIFSKNLVHFLQINGKSQTDLSRFIGVSTATVSDWCKGKKLPRMDKVQAISKWLGIENSDLIEDKSTTPDYYYNKEVRELADFLHKNPDYKVLFDASRKVKPEDIEFVKQMIDRMRGDTDGVS